MNKDVKTYWVIKVGNTKYVQFQMGVAGRVVQVFVDDIEFALLFDKRIYAQEVAKGILNAREIPVTRETKEVQQSPTDKGV